MVKQAWIDDISVITVEGPFNADATDIHLKGKNEDFSGKVKKDNNIHKIYFKELLPLDETLYLEWEENLLPVYPRKIVQTEWFQNTFHAKNEKLGAIYTPEGTSFAIWSPIATEIKLCLDQAVYTMKKCQYGVWKVYMHGDWAGAVYQYEATVLGQTKKVNDPYAKGLTANSKKGVVANLRKTDPDSFYTTKRPSIPLEDTIIYEVHVRDATISPSSGVRDKGYFKGLTEKGTSTNDKFKTGIDYFKELGITHVQLLPINDFARVDELAPHKSYNWGYDPLFFQVPEGSYATDPTNAISRIQECKDMIHAFHKEGLAVIVDVVFNHVFKIEASPFEALVPGYYFRFNEDGTPSNGTGVGNDIASERPMVRKFILDTIDYWLQEYKVDGFRFDLMGILDVETMKLVRTRCDEEESPIFLLGEGWDLPTQLPFEEKATIFQAERLQGISFFNDQFRDTVRGNNFHVHDHGFVNGKGKYNEKLLQLVSGSCHPTLSQSLFQHPTQSVNYVECHDNHTLWDRLEVTHQETETSIRKQIHQLATGLVLLSQGIPFLHAGQEWFRSKFGDENSYISGDTINQLNWEQMGKNTEHIEFVKSCIALRKSSPLFRMTSRDVIKKHLLQINTPAPIFGYTLLGTNEDFAIFINPTDKKFTLRLSSPGRWKIVLSNNPLRSYPSCCLEGDVANISDYEFLVLKKDR